MDYLSSVSTNQFGLALWAKENLKDDERITQSERYALGDMNTTIIHTVNGKSIMIQHDTTSPRPYSRIHLVQGTKGMAVKYPESLVDSQNLGNRAKSMCWIRVSGMVFTVFQAPMFIIAFKLRASQVVDISAFGMNNFSQQSLAGHIQCGQFKEVVTTIFKHHAMKLRFFGLVDQRPTIL